MFHAGNLITANISMTQFQKRKFTAGLDFLNSPHAGQGAVVNK
jgi:hypothetical protein